MPALVHRDEHLPMAELFIFENLLDFFNAFAANVVPFKLKAWMATSPTVIGSTISVLLSSSAFGDMNSYSFSLFLFQPRAPPNLCDSGNFLIVEVSVMNS